MIKINTMIARVFEAPLKCGLLEKLSLLYDQTMAITKITAKHTAKMILPVVNILFDFGRNL